MRDALCPGLRPLPLQATLAQILLCVVCAFASFACAEGWLHVSGVLATMTAGVTINMFWRKQHQRIHAHLWEFLEYCLNILLFTLAGTEVGRTATYGRL